jgi:hypothetical protein
MPAKAVLNPTGLNVGDAEEELDDGTTTEKVISNGGLTPARGLVETTPLAPVNGLNGLEINAGESCSEVPPLAEIRAVSRVARAISPATRQVTVVFSETGADP